MSRIYSLTQRFFWDEDSQSWQPNPAKAPTQGECLVLEAFQPNRLGVSDWVHIEAPKEKYPEITGRLGGNGGSMFSREIAREFDCSMPLAPLSCVQTVPMTCCAPSSFPT